MGPGTIAALEALLAEWQCSPAQSSAALRTPMDQAIALQNATERSRKNSAWASSGSGLQSKAAIGMTSFAPPENI